VVVDHDSFDPGDAVIGEVTCSREEKPCVMSSVVVGLDRSRARPNLPVSASARNPELLGDMSDRPPIGDHALN
jgi:hypothetical protein